MAHDVRRADSLQRVSADVRDGALPKFRYVFSTGGCPGWDKYLADAAVGDGRFVAYNAATTSLKRIDLGATPGPKVAVETKANRIRWSFPAAIRAC